MKKFIKIFLLAILAILVILIVSPYLFKGKIIKEANAQLEKNLLAKASFEDINISLIRNFPNLGLRLKNLRIIGINEFEGDTLLDIKTIDMAVNLISAIKMENIEIKRILINEPYINAIVLKDGKANWDIMPVTDSASEEQEDTTASEFKIALKLFRISNARINYNDLSSGIKAAMKKMDFTLSGNLSEDFSKLIIDSKAENLDVTMDGIGYLKNVLLSMHFDVDANLKESIFKLNENKFTLNELALMWNGSVEMPESGVILTDLTFETSNTDFKTLLSLVPAIYMNDFNDLKTTGKLKLAGKINGAVTETTTPSADAELLVSNATFSYPDLPKTAKNIQMDVKIHYDGAQADNTTVDVNKFHIELGANPIDMVLNLKTPVSDPFTNGKLVATIDLESLKDVIPLEGTELKGMIKANLDWMGKYSSIEKERYEEFKADGTIEVNDLYYNSPDIPKSLTLKNSLITFSPKSLEIANFDAVIGASDFRLYGKVSNYIAYILKDETVKGELSLKSNLLDINEFMNSEEVENETSTIEDTASIEVFPVPENIDFRFTSSIGKVLYDKLDIRNFEGVIQMKDKKLIMENLSMNALDGSLLLSGEYNTVDIKNPYVDLKIAAKGIDIPMCFVAFDVLGKIAPVAAKATGKVNLGMTYSSLLDKKMSPVVNTIAGSGNLSSEQIGIKGSNAFSAIGAALKTDALNNLTLKDVNFDFVIQEGTLAIKPFETQMGDVALKIEGQQSFEKTLNYTINLNAPRQLLGLENPAINNLYNQAASGGLDIVKSETVALLVKLTGDIKNPQVKLDLKENAANVVENVKEEIKDAAKEVIETQTTKIKDEAKEKSRAEADKIIKEAEKQAASVRTESKKAADAVRAEANANANKLMNEAKNPISKRAAEPAAKKLRDEGEAKAKRIEREADQKATRIVNDAKAKSDKLLQ